MVDTVLVVDDMPRLVEMHVALLDGSGLQVVTATTLEELDARYNETRDHLVGIILDGCVPGDEVTTYPFIERVKTDRTDGMFTGVVIAASSDDYYRMRMVQAGCTHEAPKHEAAMYLRELLRL